MPRALLNFQNYRDLWNVHFIEADCRTGIRARTRDFHFVTEDGLRRFVTRCSPDDMAIFEKCIRSWGKGSCFVNLTNEQYAKLKTYGMSRRSIH